MLLVVSHTRVVIFLRRFVDQNVGEYLPSHAVAVSAHSWSHGTSGQSGLSCVLQEEVRHRSPVSNSTWIFASTDRSAVPRSQVP